MRKSPIICIKKIKFYNSNVVVEFSKIFIPVEAMELLWPNCKRQRKKQHRRDNRKMNPSTVYHFCHLKMLLNEIRVRRWLKIKMKLRYEKIKTNKMIVSGIS